MIFSWQLVLDGLCQNISFSGYRTPAFQPEFAFGWFCPWGFTEKRVSPKYNGVPVGTWCPYQTQLGPVGCRWQEGHIADRAQQCKGWISQCKYPSNLVPAKRLEKWAFLHSLWTITFSAHIAPEAKLNSQQHPKPFHKLGHCCLRSWCSTSCRKRVHQHRQRTSAA